MHVRLENFIRLCKTSKLPTKFLLCATCTCIAIGVDMNITAVGYVIKYTMIMSDYKIQVGMFCNNTSIVAIVCLPQYRPSLICLLQ